MVPHFRDVTVIDDEDSGKTIRRLKYLESVESDIASVCPLPRGPLSDSPGALYGVNMPRNRPCYLHSSYGTMAIGSSSDDRAYFS